ncbi:MAG: NAD(P)-dependent oxidoreductase [Salibacteraceae bacterium]
MKILIIDRLHEVLINMLLSAGFQCDYRPEWSVNQVEEALITYEGLILRSRLSIGSDLMDANKQLKFIGRVGAGLEHIDVNYAKRCGIDIISSPEGNRQAVAEHALGSLLTLFNRIHIANQQVREGKWLRKENEGTELQGKTIAIIGYGNTGSAFAQVLSGFQTKVIAFDKYKSGFSSPIVDEVAMKVVYDEADVVSLHLPMSSETTNLVNKHWIDQFRKPFYLINTSRGKVVKTADLLNAIDTGKVLGACLDVLEFETDTLQMPHQKQLPASAQKLYGSEQVVLTPHTAGLTAESYRKLSVVLAQKIIEKFSRA